MRKLRTFYLSLLAVASLGFMTSCGDDEDDTPTPPPVAEMTTYTVRILGNQNNTTSGSFFSATDGVVRNSTDAKANSGLIDLLYYHSSPTSGDPVAAANAATIASPEDTKAKEIYNSTTNGLQTWTTRNATMFKFLGTNTSVYTDITNGDQITTAYTSSTANATTAVTQLKAGDVFGFVTIGGKHGIAKVNSVTTTTASPFATEIRMDVKVKK